MTTNMVGPIWQNVYVHPPQRSAVPVAAQQPPVHTVHAIQPPPVLYVDQSGNLIGEYPAARMPHSTTSFNNNNNNNPYHHHHHHHQQQSAFDAAVADVFFSLSRPVTTAGRILRFVGRTTYRAAACLVRGVYGAGRFLFCSLVAAGTVAIAAATRSSSGGGLQLAVGSAVEIQVLTLWAVALGMGALCVADGGVVFCLNTVSQAIVDLIGLGPAFGI